MAVLGTSLLQKTTVLGTSPLQNISTKTMIVSLRVAWVFCKSCRYFSGSSACSYPSAQLFSDHPARGNETADARAQGPCRPLFGDLMMGCKSWLGPPFHRNSGKLVLGCIDADFASIYSCCKQNIKCSAYKIEFS